MLKCISVESPHKTAVVILKVVTIRKFMLISKSKATMVIIRI